MLHSSIQNSKGAAKYRLVMYLPSSLTVGYGGIFPNFTSDRSCAFGASEMYSEHMAMLLMYAKKTSASSAVGRRGATR
jgi:hypothetical protein